MEGPPGGGTQREVSTGVGSAPSLEKSHARVCQEGSDPRGMQLEVPASCTLLPEKGMRTHLDFVIVFTWFLGLGDGDKGLPDTHLSSLHQEACILIKVEDGIVAQLG